MYHSYRIVDHPNEVVNLFISTMKEMREIVNESYDLVGRIKEDYQISSRLMDGPEAEAILTLLREEGFEVGLTSGLFYPNRYAVVLTAY